MPEKNPFSLFFSFLRNPVTPRGKGNSKSLKNFILLFLFSMVIDVILDQLSESYWLIDKLKVINTESRAEEIYSDGFWITFMSSVIITPILEELIQRSYLTSFKWNNIFVPINIGLILVFLFQIRGYLLFILCILVLVISNIIYSKLLENKKTKTKLLKFYSKNFKFYFYLSGISFGMVHIGNYEMENYIPFLSIILVLPQIFGGLMLGYIRIVMGLRWSICFHASHNLVFLIFLFINHSAK